MYALYEEVEAENDQESTHTHKCMRQNIRIEHKRNKKKRI